MSKDKYKWVVDVEDLFSKLQRINSIDDFLIIAFLQ